MNIFITGANGFIGRHLIEGLLSSGHHNILGLHRSQLTGDLKALPITWIQGDITRDRFIDELIEVDYVFHCAASLRLDESEDSQKELNLTNIDATIRLANDSYKAGVSKFIYISSIAAREMGGKAELSEEEGEPISLYGLSKLKSEIQLRNHLNGKMNYLIFRPAAVFGEHHRGSIFELVKAINNHRFVMIGNGENRVNFLYVKELINAIICVSFSSISNETFIVNHPSIELKELINAVRSILGIRNSNIFLPKFIGLLLGELADIISNKTSKNLPISRKRVNAMCRNVYYSPQKMVETGIYNEKFSFREGLKNTINWYATSNMLNN